MRSIWDRSAPSVASKVAALAMRVPRSRSVLLRTTAKAILQRIATMFEEFAKPKPGRRLAAEGGLNREMDSRLARLCEQRAAEVSYISPPYLP